MSEKSKTKGSDVPHELIAGLNAGVQFRCFICNKLMDFEAENLNFGFNPEGIYHYDCLIELAHCFRQLPENLKFQLREMMTSLKTREENKEK